jgi:hypothetical protein
MADPGSKHAFVSYVHEDEAEVGALCAVLEAAQIPYWRDRTSLGPGDVWKNEIRGAIRNGSLVFLACFSDNYRARDASYMNEELTLAVEEFRQKQPGRAWLIPIRFDAGPVPDMSLGAGLVLDDLNRVDLFGGGHMANMASLIAMIHQLMGEKPFNTATALAAVEQATTADRSELLKRLTKQMLPDPTRQIEIDDLISQEVRRVMSVLTDPEPATSLTGSNDEQLLQVAQAALDTWSVAAPFCASLQVAARWGSPDALTTWSSALQSFVSAATRINGGSDSLLHLRHIPGVAGIMTATIACITAGKWANLKALTVDASIRDRHNPQPLRMLEATDPYRIFGTFEYVANTVARASTQGRELAEVFEELTQQRLAKYFQPAAEWLHSILRPVFADQLPDDSAYDLAFDQAEVILGALTYDMANVRAATNPEASTWMRTHWFGRSTWRANQYQGNAVQDLAQELRTQGDQWRPLQAGLFGADKIRAEKALEDYAEQFTRIAASSH